MGWSELTELQVAWTHAAPAPAPAPAWSAAAAAAAALLAA